MVKGGGVPPVGWITIMKLRPVKDILNDEPTLGRALKLAGGVDLCFIARAASDWDGLSVWDVYHDDSGNLYAYTPNHDYGAEYVEARFHNLGWEVINNPEMLERFLSNFSDVVAEMFDSIGDAEWDISSEFNYGDISFRFEPVEELFE
ncbi:hypothetical protein [Vibrio phage Va2]|nr:hypothetical protein [Vibrio phage Va2]